MDMMNNGDFKKLLVALLTIGIVGAWSFAATRASSDDIESVRQEIKEVEAEAKERDAKLIALTRFRRRFTRKLSLRLRSERRFALRWRSERLPACEAWQETMDSGVSNSILGWLTAAVAGVAALVTASVRGEKLRNKVDVISATVSKHDEIIGVIRKDLHSIRENVHIMRALSERDS